MKHTLRLLGLLFLSVPLSIGFAAMVYWTTRNILLVVFTCPPTTALSLGLLLWQVHRNEPQADHR